MTPAVPERSQAGHTPRPRSTQTTPPSAPTACAAFTLIELAAVIGIMFLLVVLLMPLGKTMLRRAEAARDTNKLRSYGSAVHMMANELNMVSAGDILNYGTNVHPYVGGRDAAAKLLNSKVWTEMTRPQAAREGKRLSERTRSYTLNQTLFPPKASPPAASWEIDEVTPIRLRSFPNRPLLYTGVYLGVHDGAYNWGERGHANPIYSGVTKEQPSSSINGKTLVLFVGGEVRMVDFATENMPITGPSRDPEKWWVRQ